MKDVALPTPELKHGAIHNVLKVAKYLTFYSLKELWLVGVLKAIGCRQATCGFLQFPWKCRDLIPVLVAAGRVPVAADRGSCDLWGHRRSPIHLTEARWRCGFTVVAEGKG